MKSKRTRACEFDQRTREIIKSRDGGCIFCQMGYPKPGQFTASSGLQIMHYIPRSQGGLGIPENGAVGCIYHHMVFDNGNKHRKEMESLFRGYLKMIYPDWDENKLKYDKWRNL